MYAVDLHCDTLSRMRRGEAGSLLKNELHVDLEKLRRGGYMLQCFAAFVDLDEDADPLAAALEQMDIFDREMKKYPGLIASAKTWTDIEKNRAAGRISAVLTAEEGMICQGDADTLRMLYDRGVRIMTLTWNHENALAFPNDVMHNRPDDVNGLKELGFEIVHEMERLGMIVDVSHLSDAGFFDVCRWAKRPFIASHSNARAVCGHVRNLTDGMLRAIAGHGGVVGVNYCPDFLDLAGGAGTVARMAEHIEHIRSVAGIETAALGSDFDGIDRVPEISDCSRLPLLEDELRRRGFSDDAVEKVFSGNALRIFKEFFPK